MSEKNAKKYKQNIPSSQTLLWIERKGLKHSKMIYDPAHVEAALNETKGPLPSVRHHIRSVQYCKPLSKKWLTLARSMREVAEVAFMESPVRRRGIGIWEELEGEESSENSPSTLGKKRGGTLWDAAIEQMSVQIFLEEGKLNLCLRMLVEFKEKTELPTWGELITITANRLKISMQSLLKQCTAFERGCGMILALAMNFPEVLQILDLEVCIRHIGRTMKNSNYFGLLFQNAKSFRQSLEGHDKLQPILVFEYFYEIVKNVEQGLDGEKVLTYIADNGIVPLSLQIARKINPKNVSFMSSYAKSIHHLFGIEEFDSEMPGIFSYFDQDIEINREESEKNLVYLLTYCENTLEKVDYTRRDFLELHRYAEPIRQRLPKKE